MTFILTHLCIVMRNYYIKTCVNVTKMTYLNLCLHAFCVRNKSRSVASSFIQEGGRLAPCYPIGPTGSLMQSRQSFSSFP